MRSPIRAIAVLFATASLVSCTAAPDRPVASRAPASSDGTPPGTGAQSPTTSNERGAPSKHWVQNQQLRGLMKTISAKMLSDWPDEHARPRSDRDPKEVEKAFQAAVKLAEGLEASAEGIPASVEHISMSAASRAGFGAEAETLRRQAIGLGDAARARNADRMQHSLDAISATCISCHSRYRDFAGELDTQRAGGGSTPLYETAMLSSRNVR